MSEKLLVFQAIALSPFYLELKKDNLIVGYVWENIHFIGVCYFGLFTSWLSLKLSTFQRLSEDRCLYKVQVASLTDSLKGLGIKNRAPERMERCFSLLSVRTGFACLLLLTSAILSVLVISSYCELFELEKQPTGKSCLLKSFLSIWPSLGKWAAVNIPAVHFAVNRGGFQWPTSANNLLFPIFLPAFHVVFLPSVPCPWWRKGRCLSRISQTALPFLAESVQVQLKLSKAVAAPPQVVGREV